MSTVCISDVTSGQNDSDSIIHPRSVEPMHSREAEDSPFFPASSSFTARTLINVPSAQSGPNGPSERKAKLEAALDRHKKRSSLAPFEWPKLRKRPAM